MTTKKTKDDMLPEYDLSGAIRGKHAGKYRRDVRLVQLYPDVAEYFPDAESVNHALRAIIAAIPAKRRRTRSKASVS
jgi:hypothetical protein